MPYRVVLLILLLFPTITAAGPEHQVVTELGRIPFTAFRITEDHELDIAAHLHELDKLHWVSLPTVFTDPALIKAVLRIDLHITPEDVQALVASMPIFYVGDVTLYVVKDGQTLQKESIGYANNVSARTIHTSYNIVPLAIHEPGDYSLIITSNDELPRRSIFDITILPERSMGFTELPKKVAFDSMLLGIQSVFLLFLTLMLSWRFRLEYAFAGAFILGSWWITLVRDGLVFPLFGLSGQWLNESMLSAAIFLSMAGAIFCLWFRLKPLPKWINYYALLNGVVLMLLIIPTLLVESRQVIPIVSAILGISWDLAIITLAGIAAIRAYYGSWRIKLFALAWCSFVMVVSFVNAANVMFLEKSYNVYLNTWSIAHVIIAVWIFVDYLWEIVQQVLSQHRDQASTDSRVDMIKQLSHEIRTPLNAIIGLADLIQTHQDNETKTKYSEMIQTSSQALLGLVNDILNFSQLGEHDNKVVKQSFRLDAALMDVFQVLAPKIRASGVLPILRFSPELPFSLIGNPVAFKQVLTNLGNHAISFSPRGGKVEMIITPGDLQHGHLQLRCTVLVSDHSICSTQLENLFDPFIETSASDDSRINHAGLSLAITRMLIKEMRGSIEAHDGAQGTVFDFDMWLQVDNNSPDLQAIFTPFKAKRIAWVCYEAYARNTLQPSIEYFGATIETFENLKSAVSRIDSFDLLLIDTMDKLDDTNIALLEESCSKLPVVLIDLQSGNIDKTRFASNCSFLKLTKPRLNLIAEIANHFATQPITLPMDTSPKAVLNNSSHRTLVVDDNKLNLMVCAKVLESLGINHKTAEGGREALELAKSENFSLILLDCEMPDIDGYCVAKTIRELEALNCTAAIPIVALTAHTLQDVKDKCMAAGMNEVIHKPVSREKLAAVFERYDSQAPSTIISANLA